MSPPAIYDVFPASVSTADINADGIVDLIVSNNRGASNGMGTVGLLLGRGDGTFQRTIVYSSGGYGSGSAAIGDLNGDQHLDVVVANACSTPFSSGNCFTTGSVGVLLGNGDGTFQPTLTYRLTYDAGGRFANSVAIADVNGDLKPDLVAGTYSNSVSVLLGNGDGTFHLGSTYNSYGEVAVVAEDVNDDAIPDLLVANLYNNLAVFLGNGDGSFQAAVTYESGGSYAASIAVMDVSGDGKPDLLVANRYANNEDFEHDGVVGVLFGNGDGTFQRAVSYDAPGHQPTWIAGGDVNGDGKPDLVVADCAASTKHCGVGNGVVGVLLNRGDGTFQPAMTCDSGGVYAISVALADFNGDGKTDVSVVNGDCTVGCTVITASVAVLLNSSTDISPRLVSVSTTPDWSFFIYGRDSRVRFWIA